MKPFQNSTGTFTSLFLVLCDPQTLSAKLTKAFQLTVKEVIKLVFQGVKNSLFMLHFINTCILGGGNFQICKSQGLLRLEEPRFCPKPHSHIVDMGKWLIMEIANGSPKLGVTVSLRHGQCRGISCWNLLHLFQHFVFKCTACERIFFFDYYLSQSFQNISFPINQVDIDRSFWNTSDCPNPPGCVSTANRTVLLGRTQAPAAAFWTPAWIFYLNP